MKINCHRQSRPRPYRLCAGARIGNAVAARRLVSATRHSSGKSSSGGLNDWRHRRRSRFESLQQDGNIIAQASPPTTGTSHTGNRSTKIVLDSLGCVKTGPTAGATRICTFQTWLAAVSIRTPRKQPETCTAVSPPLAHNTKPIPQIPVQTRTHPGPNPRPNPPPRSPLEIPFHCMI